MTRPGQNFKAILLDMNGTFMFGQDRFGPTEDFFATYQCIGADRLTSEEVEAAVRSAYLFMGENYSNPERVDDFPSLADALHRVGVPESEVPAMENVFAAHEIGHIPADHLQLLQDLGASYDLGIVSNIWAPKGLWLTYFEQLGIGTLWKTVVFSSDGHSIKPSRTLFQQAIVQLGVEPLDILFIGDSFQADIVPAKALGMWTAWVGPETTPHPMADWTAPSLLDLGWLLKQA